MGTGNFVYYRYNPSLGAAITFVILFSICTIIHAYQLVRHRAWFFIPFLVGCIFELLGYVGRALSAKETPDWTFGAFMMQSLLLLVGPLLLAASIYMTLGRLIRFVGADSHSLFRPSHITKIFVLGDVIAFLTQSAGGGLYAAANTQSSINAARWIITGGLIIQVISFAFFMVVALLFHRRLAAAPTDASQRAPWRRCLYTLYATSLLILVRSVFRVVEFALGYDGVLQTSEVYIYVFDATLMFLVVLIMNVSHPAAILKGVDKNTLGHYDDIGRRDPEAIRLEESAYAKRAAKYSNT